MRGYRETEQIGAGAAAEDRDCVAGCGKAPATSDGRSQYQYVATTATVANITLHLYLGPCHLHIANTWPTSGNLGHYRFG